LLFRVVINQFLLFMPLASFFSFSSFLPTHYVYTLLSDLYQIIATSISDYRSTTISDYQSCLSNMRSILRMKYTLFGPCFYFILSPDLCFGVRHFVKYLLLFRVVINQFLLFMPLASFFSFFVIFANTLCVYIVIRSISDNCYFNIRLSLFYNIRLSLF
jgi:hypothetical protein